MVLTAYRSCLRQEGYEVESASDGVAAIEKLPLLKPGLVILDLMLPKLNGIAVLNFIRSDPDLNATPVLILSNAYLDNPVSNAVTASANQCLPKTQCTPAKLLQTVRELLGRSAADPASTPPGATPPPAVSAETITALVQAARANLFQDSIGEIAKVRALCAAFVKAGSSPAGKEPLDVFYQELRFLSARAALGDCGKVAMLASALEAMLFEIDFKKSLLSPSALRTITQAVDGLSRLLQKGDTHSAEAGLLAKVLIVDDDPICNFVTEATMKRAKLEPCTAPDPHTALEMAGRERFDVVLLDINMPELSGFEVCKSLRRIPGYETTPVIFVTSYSDFQNRAQALLSGGNDIITKPISPLELAVKTIINLIEPPAPAPLSKPGAESDASPPSTPAGFRPSTTPDRPIENRRQIAAIHGAAKDPAASAAATTRIQNGSPNRVPPACSDANDAAEVPAPPPARETMTAPLIALPPSLASADRNHSLSNYNHRELLMKNRTDNTHPLDLAAREIARIIFGDEQLTEMSQRLTRLALEHYRVLEIINRPPETVNRTNGANGTKLADPQGEKTGRVARAVAHIIFDDAGISEMHLRLTRIALEHYSVLELLTHSSGTRVPDDTHTGNGHGLAAHSPFAA